MVSENPFPLHRWRLDNGLTVVLQPDSRVPLVAVHLCLKSGSRHDPPDRSGLAHLCEHLVCDGLLSSTEALSRRIRGVGGASHGWIYHDRCSFSDTAAAEYLELALEVAAERLSGAANEVCEQSCHHEQRILLRELGERGGHPLLSELETLYGLLYPDPHPYHRPPGGTVAGIQALRAADVGAYCERHYRPSNAVLVVSGDFSVARAEQAVSRHLAAIRNTSISRAAGGADDRGAAVTPRVADPKRLARQRIAATPGDRRNRVYAGFRIAGLGQPDWVRATLLARGLATGRSSPLRRRLIEEAAVAADLRLSIETMKDASTLTFIAAARPGVGLDRLEGELLRALDDLLRRGLEREQLRRTRKRALIDHYSLLQKLDRRADLLAAAIAFLDDPTHLTEAARHLGAARREELIATGETLAAAGPGAVLLVGPAEVAAA